MKRENYKVVVSGVKMSVSDELDEKLRNSWDIHNMKANGAEGRKLRYVGYSMRDYRTDEGHRIMLCWYKDETGEYWHESRILVDGNIISSNQYYVGVEKDRPAIENSRMVPRAYKGTEESFAIVG